MTEETKELDVQKFLQDKAKDIVLTRNGDVANPGPELEAEFAHEMFVQSVEARQLFRDAQGQLAAYVLREHLWVHYPRIPFTDDYKGFRMFLASTGLGDSTVSELAALYHVIPLCDENDIKVDSFIGPGEWTKTREAITALKYAAIDRNVKRVRNIFTTIRKTDGSSLTVARAALRKKFRNQQDRDKPGHGTTVRLPGGKQAVVVVFDQDEEIKKALIKLGSLTEWDLLDVKLEVR